MILRIASAALAVIMSISAAMGEDGFRKLPIKDGVRVTTILKHNTGSIWVGTDSDGIYCFKNGSLAVHHKASRHGLPDNSITAFARDRRNNVWIATGDGRITLFAPWGELRPFTGGAFMTSTNVSCFTYDKKRDIMYAGTDKGVNAIYLTTGETLTDFGPVDGDVTTLLLDSRGYLWIGTKTGVYQYDRTKRRLSALNLREELKSAVNVIFETSSGAIMISSDQGLTLYDHNTQAAERFDTGNAPAGSAVTAIAEDGQGNIWLATDDGISCVDSVSGYIYDYMKGNSSAPGTSLADDDGAIYFGSTSGLVGVDPGNVSKLTAQLTAIEFSTVLGIRQDTISSGNGRLRLDAENNGFTVDFGPSTPVNNRLIGYRYKLEGFDSDWHAGQTASYEDLPGGRYTLHAEASLSSDPDKIFSARMEVSVAGRWYSTPAAYLIYILTAATVILFLFGLSKKRKPAKKEPEKKAAKESKQKRAGQSKEQRKPMAEPAEPDAKGEKAPTIEVVETVAAEPEEALEQMSVKAEAEPEAREDAGQEAAPEPEDEIVERIIVEYKPEPEIRYETPTEPEPDTEQEPDPMPVPPPMPDRDEVKQEVTQLTAFSDEDEDEQTGMVDTSSYSGDDTLMKKVLEIITANYENPGFSVEDLSREAGMSRVHLNRKLKESANISPNNLIRSIRMRQAVILLIDRQVSIAEVANRVGFSTHSYFSNNFHDYFGMTPKDFVTQYSNMRAEDLLNSILGNGNEY